MTPAEVHVRNIITTALEVLGLSSVTIGAALVSPAAGFMVGGVLAVGLGYWLGEQ